MYRYYAWKQEHSRYGGARTSFGAGFWGLLQIYLIIVVILILLPAIGMLVNLPAMEWLSPLICLIVSPWLICMFFNWETRSLVVGDEEGIKHFPPVKMRFLWILIFILIVLVAMAAAALFVKDRLGIQMSEMGNLNRLLGMKGEGAIKSGSVRGRVKRPSRKTAPATAPRAAEPARQPHPEKGTHEEPIIPVWTGPADETAPSSGEYEREIRDLDAFIEKDRQNADAYYSRGCLRARMGDLENAEKDFTRAIEINKRSSDAHYNRGLVLARMEKLDLAVKDFDEAIELDPNAADAYCNRGSAYFQLGKSDLAMKDYNKALEMKPDDGDLYYNRGLVYLSMGRTVEAKADFKKAIALKPRPTSKPPGKKAAEAKPAETKEPGAKEAGSFDAINITNVPIASFLDEVKDKIDVSKHPTYQKMAQARDRNRQFVDPFYSERNSGKTPAYEFRQFTSTRNMPDIIDWYKKKASLGPDGTGDAFAQGGGSYANGPFDNAAANFGVNNGRNFIVLTAMKAPEDDRVTVYLFHYRKGPAQETAPDSTGLQVR
jgi:tetratricopeptide (TPR) repeat protein